MTLTSVIPGLEDFYFVCGRHNGYAKFKESILELSNHVVQTINYGGDKLAASIQNLQMVFTVVPDEFSDNVAAMTPVRHNMWIGDWTEATKEHRGIHQDTPKGCATAFKMCTQRLLTKLDGINGYDQVHANQDVVGILLIVRGIFCEYNINRQDTYIMMKAKNV